MRYESVSIVQFRLQATVPESIVNGSAGMRVSSNSSTCRLAEPIIDGHVKLMTPTSVWVGGQFRMMKIHEFSRKFTDTVLKAKWYLTSSNGIGITVNVKYENLANYFDCRVYRYDTGGAITWKSFRCMESTHGHSQSPVISLTCRGLLDIASREHSPLSTINVDFAISVDPPS